jgi:RNA-directed DNA polymerase
VTYPSTGSPQGGVISPLLANVYLHYVLDVWWEEAVKPRLAGRASLIRYADDCAPRRHEGSGAGLDPECHAA